MLKRIILHTILALPTFYLMANQESRLLRFPATNGDEIVFSYAGDLYKTLMQGGEATKLTSDIGYEMFPRFSPDGKTIAFTAQYDGNTEVYTIPKNGGEPSRKSFSPTLSRDEIGDRMGPNNIVMGWNPNGKDIIFRSRMNSYNSFVGQLFTVDTLASMPIQLPLSEGGFCSYSPDGKKIAFNRVFREFRTWKYYQGGMADDIWIFNFETKTLENITQTKSQDIIPMWVNNKIYYISDRERTMNIYMYDIALKTTQKITTFTDFDVKFPSYGGGYIVFEKGGYIYKLNTENHIVEKITISIQNDFINARTKKKKCGENISDIDLSPNGERVIVSARGDVFSVPVETGITYNFTRSSGAHERDVAWSPNGKYISYLSDISGEYELYMQLQDGSTPPVQLTSESKNYLYRAIWSPDSKKLLFNNRKQQLWMFDIETRKATLVVQSPNAVIEKFNWSPDSRWITYQMELPNKFDAIFVYELSSQQNHQISSSWYHSSSPSFSNDGKYLLYASSRSFSPVYSFTEWNHVYLDMDKIYIVPLSTQISSPFLPKNDVLKFDKKPSDIKTDSITKIDIAGIQDRVIELPVTAANYYNLFMVDDKVYYNHINTGGKNKASVYDLKKQEEKFLGENINFLITKEKKMLVRKVNTWGVIDLPQSEIKIEKPIDFSPLETTVNYAQEWQQIYDECWRQMRDFFYVENMHGVDWRAIHEKYNVLIPYVKHRDDLTYIIGEMIGELNVGHAYILSGEKPSPAKLNIGMLGASFSKDKSGYFKIEKILKGNQWDVRYRSPLNEIGLNVKEGEYILMVNGESVVGKSNLCEMLINKVNVPVELTINAQPSLNGARKIIVNPINDEVNLFYHQMINENIQKVSDATQSEVGYIYIPDMMQNGLNEFAKNFYPQLDKKGLIIDARGNAGGNVSPMIVERLMRELTRSKVSRNATTPSSVPNQMMNGPIVLLVDKYTASDGDLIAYSFKKHQIGTVIGTRTWGGVVGISGSLPFVDGTSLNKPEFASYSSDSSAWIIEGIGVEPDITIDNNPFDVFNGKDAQLNKAIEVIQQQVKIRYKPLPKFPTPPNKTNVIKEE